MAWRCPTFLTIMLLQTEIGQREVLSSSLMDHLRYILWLLTLAYCETIKVDVATTRMDTNIQIHVFILPRLHLQQQPFQHIHSLGHNLLKGRSDWSNETCKANTQHVMQTMLGAADDDRLNKHLCFRIHLVTQYSTCVNNIECCMPSHTWIT